MEEVLAFLLSSYHALSQLHTARMTTIHRRSKGKRPPFFFCNIIQIHHPFHHQLSGVSLAFFLFCSLLFYLSSVLPLSLPVSPKGRGGRTHKRRQQNPRHFLFIPFTATILPFPSLASVSSRLPSSAGRGR